MRVVALCACGVFAVSSGVDGGWDTFPALVSSLDGNGVTCLVVIE